MVESWINVNPQCWWGKQDGLLRGKRSLSQEHVTPPPLLHHLLLMEQRRWVKLAGTTWGASHKAPVEVLPTFRSFALTHVNIVNQQLWENDGAGSSINLHPPDAGVDWSHQHVLSHNCFSCHPELGPWTLLDPRRCPVVY